MKESLRWELKSFEQLDTKELFDLLHLRQQVFVLEQHCLYPDIDTTDLSALHLLGYTSALTSIQTLGAYLRVIPPTGESSHYAIGRVVTAPSHRGGGMGKVLMQAGIDAAARMFPESTCKISAQAHLEGFYHSLGFEKISAPYDEDGIMHIDMVRGRVEG